MKNILFILLGITLLVLTHVNAFAGKPFGGQQDLAYSDKVWQVAERAGFVGSASIVTRPYKGAPPHGLILELLEKNTIIDGVTGPLVVKKNYGGNGLTIEDVINDPSRYLEAVTIMFQREKGYDSENKDWFYAKYDPAGNLMTNPKGIKLAGRVAKGAPTGCISCHKPAPGGDFIFNHDRYQ